MFSIFGFWQGLGTLTCAVALLFGALRLHGSSGKHTKVTKPAGLILAFVAGLASLATVFGGWMVGLGATFGMFAAAALIACVFIVGVDWLLDKKPDKPAFWAAFALPIVLVLGLAQIPAVFDLVGTGANRVQVEMSSAGR